MRALCSASRAGAVFRYLMRRILIGASRDIEYDLRNAFFARLQQMPLGYYQARRTGDLMSRATNDLNAVRMMIGPAVMYSANTILVFVVAIVLMLSIDTQADADGARAAAARVDQRPLLRQRHPSASKRSRSSSPTSAPSSRRRWPACASSAPTTRKRTRSSGSTRRTDEYVRRNRGLIRLQGLFFPSMTLFLGFGSLLVLWLGSREVIRGRITLGEFVAFNAYLVMLSWPMIAFGWVTNILQRGMASWKRMLEVLDAVPAISDQR